MVFIGMDFDWILFTWIYLYISIGLYKWMVIFYILMWTNLVLFRFLILSDPAGGV